MASFLRKLFGPSSKPSSDLPGKCTKGKHSDCIAHRTSITIRAAVGGDVFVLHFFPDQIDDACCRLGEMAADNRLAMTGAAAKTMAAAARCVAAWPAAKQVQFPIATSAVVGWVLRE
jgi:hypothetical protein